MRINSANGHHASLVNQLRIRLQLEITVLTERLAPAVFSLHLYAPQAHITNC